MKKIMALLLVSVLAVFSCGKSGTSVQSELKVKVINIKGHADVVRNRTAETIRLNMVLGVNDRIRTFTGTVDLKIVGRGLLKIQPNTVLELASIAQDVNIGLKQGKILIVLNKLRKNDHFSVTSPTAVVGVRGTSFLVSSSDKQFKTGVLTGRVEITSGGVKTACNELKEVVVSDGTVRNQTSMAANTSSDLKDIIKITEIETMNDYEKIRLNIKKLGVVASAGKYEADEGLTEGLNSGSLQEEGVYGKKKVDAKSTDMQAEKGIDSGDRKIKDDEFGQ